MEGHKISIFTNSRIVESKIHMNLVASHLNKYSHLVVTYPILVNQIHILCGMSELYL